MFPSAATETHDQEPQRSFLSCTVTHARCDMPANLETLNVIPVRTAWAAYSDENVQKSSHVPPLQDHDNPGTWPRDR
jgi:hypothetical protein